MSSVRRVTVENGQVVVIGKDGKIQKNPACECCADDYYSVSRKQWAEQETEFSIYHLQVFISSYRDLTDP